MQASPQPVAALPEKVEPEKSATQAVVEARNSVKGYDQKQVAPKVLKAQKEYLLQALEKAITEAPEKAPVVDADKDATQLAEAQSWNGNQASHGRGCRCDARATHR